ncbi:biotin-dependent carboxyltransferase family protein [Rheinheimera sp. WS51]|uniref:5-oxoprolinase subunit C family protein n=1 Tax=Rheinheimera sp. WS51 TaxID=3425886 RepID=UPI003D938D38
MSHKMASLNDSSSDIFTVRSAGILSLLQDRGRFGQSDLGLTTGGPADPYSAAMANALLNNNSNATLIECSIGGLQLEAHCASFIAVTGAELSLTINGQAAAMWTSLAVSAGDIIELGMASAGLRAYVAVAQGFKVKPQFSSTATVLREKIGGLNGDKLQVGDTLAITSVSRATSHSLAKQHWRQFNNSLTLRLVEGYQAEQFSTSERQRFYLQPYTVTPQSDRMGYKLTGAAIHCQQQSLLSEGISYGAVQIPPDGQPIVLLNDRQTLGGYPKIGSVLSLDCALLAQASPGTKVYFTPISIEQAHNALCLADAHFKRLTAAWVQA